MQQMFDFMQNPGMVDQGGQTEPKTGNKVPPGSTKEEVADTVDAKLSVGEYVLPADVVQFIGLEKIRKMEQTAKEGLAQLDADGRLGGEKASEAEDDLPFNTEDLQTDEKEEVRMAEGGQVTQTVYYVNDEGDRIPVQMVNGAPATAIPFGYRPEGAARVTPNPEESGERRTETPDRVVGVEEGESRFAEWTLDDFRDHAENRNRLRGLPQLGMLAGPAGALLGAGIQAFQQHTDAQAMKELQSRLESEELSPEDRTAMEDLVSQYEEDGRGDGLFSGQPRDSVAARAGLFGEDKIPFNEGIWSSFRNDVEQPAQEDDEEEPNFAKGGFVKRKK